MFQIVQDGYDIPTAILLGGGYQVIQCLPFLATYLYTISLLISVLIVYVCMYVCCVL